MASERPPVHERQHFCVQCGLVDKADHVDGASGYDCGGDTIGLDQLRALLATQGLCVVSLAHKAVCDAMTKRPCYITDADDAASPPPSPPKRPRRARRSRRVS